MEKSFMASDGYVRLRRGLLEHLENGRMTYMQAGVYSVMLLQADHKTGIWWGSAMKLYAMSRGDGETESGEDTRNMAERRKLNRCLSRLEDGGYIKRFIVKGKIGNYAVLINKFMCSGGVNDGKTLNAAKSEDWRRPVYERCNEADYEPCNEACND